MVSILVKLIFSHLIGDYFLQSDYLAKNKSTDFYILFVHCALYCLPLFLFFGLTWQLAVVFIIHIIVDYLKCKKKINLFIDQLIHYLVLLIYLVWGEVNG